MATLEELTDPVLSEIGRRTPVDRSVPVRIRDFQFPDHSVSRIAIARHRADPAVSVVASLGAISAHVFICVVDGLETEVADALAKVEHIDGPLGQIRAENYVELRTTAMVRHGWVGFQLLEVVGAGATAGFPSHLTTTRGLKHCLWAIPLDVHELSIRKTGLEELLSHLENSRRDPIKLRAGEPPLA